MVIIVATTPEEIKEAFAWLSENTGADFIVKADEIKKQKKGRFVLMNVNANPGKIAEISAQLKLNNDLLKYMFVLVEE